ASVRSVRGAARVLDPDPAARLLHRRAQRHRCRSAAQPRQVGDRGMTKLRAGVLGAGAFGRIHARKYAEDARVTLVGIYDPDDERATELANTHGVEAFGSTEELLGVIDIVTIASPPSCHGETARLALGAGK